jgi:hypothetical protein
MNRVAVPQVLGAGTVVLTGAYGSGKSELALNLSAYLAGRRPFAAVAWPEGEKAPSPAAAEDVTLVDLDTLKPMFRARELEQEFRLSGIRVLGAAEGFSQADVPAVSPAIVAALRLGGSRLVVDLAGEEGGVRVLRGLLASAPERRVTFLLVVNPYRPFSGTAAEIAATGQALAAEAGVALAGVVANPHLLEETTVEQVVKGFTEVAAAARELKVPVVFAAARAELCPALAGRLGVPIFALRRYLRLPWDRPGLGGFPDRAPE